MLFSADAWPKLADGTITLTVRTWSRAQAKAGGHYRVGGMLLEATDVRQVRVDELTDSDARACGEDGLDALLRRLGDLPPDRLVWRVGLRHLGEDDRIVRRREAEPSEEQLADLRVRLERLDRRATGKPWTHTTLRLIAQYPGVVSTALARHTGQDRPAFKINVRKLKELGLTESLGTGYRLSPLGEALLRTLG